MLFSSSTERVSAPAGQAVGRRVWGSPALRVTFGHGLAGIGWVIGNLAMARLLPPDQYAYLALSIAVAQTAGALGPLGADGVAKRGRLPPTAAVLSRGIRSSALVGLAAAFIGAQLYQLDAALVAAILVATVASTLCVMAAAHLQGEQRFGAALTLSQGHILALLAVAGITALGGTQKAEVPALVFCLAYLALAGAGWRFTLAHRGALVGSAAPFPWAEAVPLLVIQCAATLLFQLDRLLIPRALGIGELATYSVLATVAGSPFRMLQVGVGYTMVPRLRAATSVQERRGLLATEGVVVAAVALGAGILCYLLTPAIVRLSLHGKYELSRALVLAAILTGVVRVLDGFAMATATALSESRDLRWLSASSWVALGVAVLGGFGCARWGLEGVIYGLALGWLTRVLLAGSLGLVLLNASRRKPV